MWQRSSRTSLDADGGLAYHLSRFAARGGRRLRARASALNLRRGGAPNSSPPPPCGERSGVGSRETAQQCPTTPSPTRREGGSLRYYWTSRHNRQKYRGEEQDSSPRYLLGNPWTMRWRVSPSAACCIRCSSHRPSESS